MTFVVDAEVNCTAVSVGESRDTLPKIMGEGSGVFAETGFKFYG